jgi:hypothetical protein
MYNNGTKYSNSKFCKSGGFLFQQTKNGLRTKFKSFNRIYIELSDETFVGFLITVPHFRQFSLA